MAVARSRQAHAIRTRVKTVDNVTLTELRTLVNVPQAIPDNDAITEVRLMVAVVDHLTAVEEDHLTAVVVDHPTVVVDRPTRVLQAIRRVHVTATHVKMEVNVCRTEVRSYVNANLATRDKNVTAAVEATAEAAIKAVAEVATNTTNILATAATTLVRAMPTHVKTADSVHRTEARTYVNVNLVIRVNDVVKAFIPITTTIKLVFF